MNERIPIYQPYLTPDNLSFAHEALDSGRLSSAHFNNLVERQLEQEFNVKHSLLVTNGTSATHLLAKALKNFYPNVKRIIAPNNVYVAAWNALLFDDYDWEIILIDSDLETWNADYSNVEAGEDTAFLIAHNIGNMVNIRRLKEKYPDSIFIEDSCEGFFGECEGERVGANSLCSALSFFGNKDLTSGEGGALLTNNEKVYEYTKSLRSQGQSERKFIHERLGYNYRMTNIQAAILHGQFRSLEHIKKRKQELFSFYRESLANLDRVIFQRIPEKTLHSNWVFAVRVLENSNYSKVEAFFNQKGIETRPMFYPASEHSYLKNHKRVKIGEENNSRTLNRECFMLPSYPSLKKEEAAYIVRSIKDFARK